MHPDHPAALPDLEDQHVRGDERVRALVQTGATGTPRQFVQVPGHNRDLRLRSDVTPNDWTSFSIRRVDTPSRYHVATTDVSARSARLRRSSNQSGKYEPDRQLRDRHVQVPARVSTIAVPVPVAGIHPLIAAFAVTQ